MQAKFRAKIDGDHAKLRAYADSTPQACIDVLRPSRHFRQFGNLAKQPGLRTYGTKETLAGRGGGPKMSGLVVRPDFIWGFTNNKPFDELTNCYLPLKVFQ